MNEPLDDCTVTEPLMEGASMIAELPSRLADGLKCMEYSARVCDTGLSYNDAPIPAGSRG